MHYVDEQGNTITAAEYNALPKAAKALYKEHSAQGVEIAGEMSEPMLTPSLKGIKFALQTLNFVKEVPMPEGLADVLTDKLKLERSVVESYSLLTFRLAEGKLVSISSGEFSNWPAVRSGKTLLPFKAAKSTAEGYSLTECVPL